MRTFIFHTDFDTSPRYLDERYSLVLAGLIRAFNPHTMRAVRVGIFAQNHSSTIPAESYLDLDNALDLLPFLTSVVLVVDRAARLPRDSGVHGLIRRGAFFPRAHLRNIAVIEHTAFDGR